MVDAVGGPDLTAWSSKRAAYLDNLKVILIAAIIAIHGVLSYAGFFDAFSYTSVREVTLTPTVEAVLLVLIAPFGLFMIALLFLVAGLLTRPSLVRKGPATFAKDRLLRLGIPYAIVVLLLQPATIYALEHPLGAAPGSYWYEFLGEERQLDSGVTWFVGVLLIFSLVYAGWVRMRGTHVPENDAHPITARQLLAISVLVVPASFLIRLVYPYGSESGFTDLNYWEWPGCIAVFGLGIAASRRGWLTEVPDRIRRQCRLAALLSIGGMAVFLLCIGLLDLIDEMFGGWNWAALTFALIEAPLTVFGSVWLLSVAQRRLSRVHTWTPTLSRSAYGAFMIQTVVLVGLALALRAVPLSAEVKAVLVAGGGVAGSFGLAWLLITRIPGVARIL